MISISPFEFRREEVVSKEVGINLRASEQTVRQGKQYEALMPVVKEETLGSAGLSIGQNSQPHGPCAPSNDPKGSSYTSQSGQSSKTLEERLAKAIKRSKEVISRLN